MTKWQGTTGEIQKFVSDGHPDKHTLTHCTYPRRDGQAELTWVTAVPAHRRSSIQVLTGPNVD